MTVKTAGNIRKDTEFTCPECDRYVAFKVGKNESRIVKCHFCGALLELNPPYPNWGEYKWTPIFINHGANGF
jgi:transcription elongation factor Elf1